MNRDPESLNQVLGNYLGPLYTKTREDILTYFVRNGERSKMLICVEAAIGIEPMNKDFAVWLRISLRLVTFARSYLSTLTRSLSHPVDVLSLEGFAHSSAHLSFIRRSVVSVKRVSF